MSEDIFNLTFNKITSNLKAKKVNLIAIHGPQGMGKTTLCKKLKTMKSGKNEFASGAYNKCQKLSRSKFAESYNRISSVVF